MVKKPAIIVFVLLLGIVLLLAALHNIGSSFKTQDELGRIKVASEIQGYVARINPSSSIPKDLESLGYWEEDSIVDHKNPSSKYTPKYIYIKFVSIGLDLLSDEKYYYVQNDEKGSPLIATSTTIDNNGNQIIEVGVSEAFMSQIKPANQPLFFDQMFWQGIYRSRVFRQSGLEVPNDTEFVKQHFNKSGTFYLEEK